MAKKTKKKNQPYYIDHRRALDRIIKDYQNSYFQKNLFSQTAEMAIFNALETGITRHKLRYYQLEAMFVLDSIYAQSQSEKIQSKQPGYRKNPMVTDLFETIDKEAKFQAPFLGYEMATGSGKTMLMGAVERGGSVTTSTAKTLTRRKLREFLRAYVSDDAEAIYTDEHPVYGDLATAGRRHESVRHKREEWVRGDVHTNTIEGFWSTLKRGIDGVYHSVSPDYLQNYLDEYGFRYNRRHDKAPMFGSLTA